MKIEIGMYCYNKTNRKLGIGQIISYQGNNNFNVRYRNDIELVSVGNIIASFNPVDLIKVGDYVNGEIVNYVDDLEGSMRQFKYDYEDVMNRGHWNEEIKTILTKEQFENNCFEVGD